MDRSLQITLELLAILANSILDPSPLYFADVFYEWPLTLSKRVLINQFVLLFATWYINFDICYAFVKNSRNSSVMFYLMEEKLGVSPLHLGVRRLSASNNLGRQMRLQGSQRLQVRKKVVKDYEVSWVGASGFRDVGVKIQTSRFQSSKDSGVN